MPGRSVQESVRMVRKVEKAPRLLAGLSMKSWMYRDRSRGQ
jgi:hypothetical protein